MRERARAIELVRRDQDGAALSRRGAHDVVEHLASVGVETRMGLVEEEETRIARPRDRESEPTALAGRELAVQNISRAAEAHALEGGVSEAGVAGRGAGSEAQVLAHGQVVVTEGLVSDEREVTARAPSVAGQVATEDVRLTGVDRHQSGEETQESRLPRSVCSRQQDDLALVDVEIDPREGRKAIQETDCRAETDDVRHTRLRAVDDERVYEPAWERVEPATRTASVTLHRCGDSSARPAASS